MMRKFLVLLVLVPLTASAQYYDQTIIPIADGIGTSGAAIPLMNGANTWSALQTFSNGVSVVGTTAADSASAGSVGEVVSLNCLVGAAGGGSTNISTPVASPGVVTWTSHTFVPSSGLANYTCPIHFTTAGTLPTGIVAGTTYYIIGSTVSGDTFQVSDTAAHALAGTNAINFTVSTSGQSGGQIGAIGTTGNPFTGSAVMLVAGDWDCQMTFELQELTALTTTQFATAVDTAIQLSTLTNTFNFRSVSGLVPTGNMFYNSPVVRENISATTAVYGVTQSSFSGGTMNQGGFLRCRRMR